MRHHLLVLLSLYSAFITTCAFANTEIVNFEASEGPRLVYLANIIMVRLRLHL